MDDKTLLEMALKALQDVVNPIAAIQRDMPEGYRLDGMAAMRAAENPETYREIARKAIAAITAQTAKSE